MPLKHDSRREMPDWLAKLTPSRLKSTDLPLQSLLTQSLYYPCCGFDGRPVQFLGGCIHSFLYVDYGANQGQLEIQLMENGFDGYSLAGYRSVEEEELAPDGWTPEVPARFERDLARFNHYARSHVASPPFAAWCIFEREAARDDTWGPARFSLLYLCADGVAAYQALYWPHAMAPEVLAIIQPGHGFGGNYTDFSDPNGLFAWTVLNAKQVPVPRFLLWGDYGLHYWRACWPDHYPNHVEWLQHEHGNGIWARTVPTNSTAVETDGELS